MAIGTVNKTVTQINNLLDEVENMSSIYATQADVAQDIATATTDMATQTQVAADIATATNDMATQTQVAQDIATAVAPLATQGALNAVEGRTTTLEGRATTIEGDITALEQTVADNKTDAENALAEAVEPLAEKNGNYPKMSVGFAENIVGDGTATEEEFSFRPTAGVNRNVETTTYDYDMRSNFGARIESVKGNSVVWNQLVDTNATSLTLAANHKYYTYIGGTIAIQSPNSATTISVNGGTDKVTDLTQMFGAGNEPTTVEEFYSLLPTNVDLNAYNEGEFVDAHYEAIKTMGFNQWDEQCRIGSYTNDGVFVTTGAQLLCNANPIRIIPNATYWRGGSASYTMVCYWYDASMNFLTISYATPNSTIVPPSNSAWLNFRMQQEYGTTYKNDICINIAWDEYSALNGTYAPYKPFERDLSWVSQYYPEGMRRAGSASDEIRFNSTTQKWEAVRRVGVVDLGDLTYSIGGTSSSYGRFQTDFSGIKAAAASNLVGNILCAKYITTTADNTYASNKGISIDTYGVVAIYDEAYNSNVATFKAAMAGVMLNYELATPLVAEIEEIPSLDYDVADYGTEELIAPEGVKSAPFLGNIIYTPNALKTLEQVPDILRRLAALENA